MPKVNQNNESENAQVFGSNVRDLRRVRGWSIDALAKRAGVASHTVHRIEHGYPSTKTRRTRIALALDTIVERLERSETPERSDLAQHEANDDNWLSLIDWRPIIPEDNEQAIQSADERGRLGRLGFVTQFVKILRCRLPKGKLVAGVLELYGDLPPSTYLGGEIFSFALKGDSYLNHDGKLFLMKEGSASTFDCTKPFFFTPVESITRTGSPTMVLYVRLEETEPIESRRPKRGRKVEGKVQAWVDPEGKVPDTTKQSKKDRDKKSPPKKDR